MILLLENIESGLYKEVRSCYSQRTSIHQFTLPHPKFLMAFISMDLLSPYSKMESGSQYTLTVICILTNHVFMIPIKTKTTDDVIDA